MTYPLGLKDNQTGLTLIEFIVAFVLTGVMIVGHPVYGEVGAYKIGPYCIVSHPVWAMVNDCLVASSADVYEKTLLNTYTV